MKQQEKKPLIILTGPTAAGKTSLSIELAKSIGGEIISADSMQVYKKMDIGTAKIRPEEMQGVPHYLIDELDPSEEFNVVAFVEKSKEAMKKIYAAGHILGYKEFFDYFDGRMTLEDTIDKIKKDTRHFAKRQLTWFRREKEVIWLNKKEYEQEKDLLDSVLNIIEEKGIRNGTKR